MKADECETVKTFALMQDMEVRILSVPWKQQSLFLMCDHGMEKISEKA